MVNDSGVGVDGSGANASVAEAVAEEIRSEGGNAVATAGDVTNCAYTEHMIRLAVAHFGTLHAVVNNAGIQVSKPLQSITEADFATVVAVKLKRTSR